MSHDQKTGTAKPETKQPITGSSEKSQLDIEHENTILTCFLEKVLDIPYIGENLMEKLQELFSLKLYKGKPIDDNDLSCLFMLQDFIFYVCRYEDDLRSKSIDLRKLIDTY